MDWWLHRSIEHAANALRRVGIELAPHRVSVTELATRGMARFDAIHPPQRVSPARPFLKIDRVPARFAQVVSNLDGGYQTGTSGIVALDSARFEFPSGLITVDGSVPSETLVQRIWPHSYQYPRAWKLRFLPGTEIASGGVFTLPHWSNTYTFLADMLPLALILVEHRDVPLYVPRTRPRFVSEYLRLLDLESRCVVLEDGVYRTSTLYVATIPGTGLDLPSPAYVQKTRSALLQHLPDLAPPHRRIYVSREDAPDRRVQNEPELVALLAGYGFEAVTLASLGVLEQLRLFAEAECVVGAHGAGLSNIVVAPSECRLIELVGNKVVNPQYPVLTSILGMPYGYVRAEDAYRNLVVPLDDVRRAVELAFPAR